MDGPILGTYIAEFKGDASQLTPALANVENQSKKTVTEVEKRINASTTAITKLNKSYEETGLATDRNLKKLVAQQLALRESIVETYGTLSKASPEAQAQYAALGRSIQQATIRTRELNHEFALQRMLSSPAGTPRTIEGAVELGLAQAGFGGMAMRLPQIAAYGLLAAEEMKLIGEVGTALGTQWKQWAEIAVHSVDRVAGKVGDASRDMLAKGWWRFLPGFVDQTGTPGGVGGNVDAILKGASYGKWQRYGKGISHVDDASTSEGGEGGSFDQGFLDKMAAAMRSYETQIATLHLQEAALTANTRAMREYQAELDRLKVKDLVASGMQEVHAKALVAEEQRVRALTQRNKEYASMLDSVDKSMQGVAEHERQAAAATDEFIKKYGLDKRIDFIGLEDTSAVNGATLRQFQGIEGALRQLDADYDENARHYKTAMSDAIYSVENLFSGVLEAGMHGKIKSIGDAWKQFLGGLEHDIAQFLAHEAVKKLLSLAIDWASKFGGGASGSTVMAANGGVLTGGFTPFANGGVVTSPTFGLVGEGKYNEAVIPLPDGRHVEAKVSGQQQSVMHQTIYLVQEPPPDVSDGRIITVVQAAMLRNGPLRKTILQSVK